MIALRLLHFSIDISQAKRDQSLTSVMYLIRCLEEGIYLIHFYPHSSEW